MWSAGVWASFAVVTTLSYQCAPPQAGNCYSGTFSSNVPNFYNQKCGNDFRKEWCAVAYHQSNNEAHFGCINSFPLTLGKTCGDGALDVNSQGCVMVDTPTGACYLCCCKGGGCNHPRAFLEEAQRMMVPGANEYSVNQLSSHFGQWSSLSLHSFSLFIYLIPIALVSLS